MTARPARPGDAEALLMRGAAANQVAMGGGAIQFRLVITVFCEENTTEIHKASLNGSTVHGDTRPGSSGRPSWT